MSERINYSINKNNKVLKISKGEITYEDLTHILQTFILGHKSNTIDSRRTEDFIIFNEDIEVRIYKSLEQ